MHNTLYYSILSLSFHSTNVWYCININATSKSPILYFGYVQRSTAPVRSLHPNSINGIESKSTEALHSFWENRGRNNYVSLKLRQIRCSKIFALSKNHLFHPFLLTLSWQWKHSFYWKKSCIDLTNKTIRSTQTVMQRKVREYLFRAIHMMLDLCT